MTIETKLTIGDFTWLMHDNKPIRAEVTGIHVNVTSASYPNSDVKYTLYGISGLREDYEVFQTKEALLQSL